jgi:hypothetical protein
MLSEIWNWSWRIVLALITIFFVWELAPLLAYALVVLAIPVLYSFVNYRLEEWNERRRWK